MYTNVYLTQRMHHVVLGKKSSSIPPGVNDLLHGPGKMREKIWKKMESKLGKKGDQQKHSFAAILWVWHKANQISICGANWCKYSWTHHRVIDGLHYSWLVLGKTLTTYPWHIIHICLIFQWPNKNNRPKRRQENAKKCDKNFLISARKKPSRPQNQKLCILKNITWQEIEFGVEWYF